MAASEDKMQDVFPVNFDFVKGEQPTASKLSAWVKQTDTGFSRITRAIGDPWDYSAHSGYGGAYNLSPEKLAQASIARFCGPSDYASPRGASFQEPVTEVITVTLQSYRNQWRLGFPLIKLTAPLDISDNGAGKIEDLEWGTDITLEGGLGDVVLTTLKTTKMAVTEPGDFHIDYAAGIITSYSIPTVSITMFIENINMLGPGTPWGTANVIPSWAQTTPLCFVTLVSSVGGTSVWNIELPIVSKSVRDTVNSYIYGTAENYAEDSVDATWRIHASGESARHRLPYQFTNSMALNDTIPVGSIYLYDNAQARILPVTAFYYVDEHNVHCEAPDLWVPLGNSVRLIVTGSSLAEDVHYLMSVMREGSHAGLSAGQKMDTIHFTSPISHSDLADTYTDYNTDPDVKFYFRASSFPTNPHPQYLHRAGYQGSDLEGNSANAMRGWLVFAGRDADMTLGTGPDGGCSYATYGLMFGGYDVAGSNGACRIAFEGGLENTSWTAGGSAVRHGFCIPAVGGVSSDFAYGALAYTPWYGTPLYLRGHYGATLGEVSGAMLGFDLCQNGEMNYIKMMPAVRTGTYDRVNLPVKTDQTETDPLDITPMAGYGLEWQRFSAAQIREFRFRGCSWNPDALNAGMSVGESVDTALDESININAIAKYASTPWAYNVITFSSSTDPSLFRVGGAVVLSGFASNNIITTITAVSDSGTFVAIAVAATLVTELPAPAGARVTVQANEFNAYFTSPGMVGCDFLNVYSNAIFFSDTGDGKATSFTTLGANWMKENGPAPTGLYYLPRATGQDPRLEFSIYDSSESDTTTPLEIGDAHGFKYYSSLGGNIWISTDGAGDDARFALVQGPGAAFMAVDSYPTDNVILAEGDIVIGAGGDMLLTADDYMRASGMGTFGVYATTQIDLCVSDNFSSYTATGDYYTRILCGPGSMSIISNDTTSPTSRFSSLAVAYTQATLSSIGGYTKMQADDAYVKVQDGKISISGDSSGGSGTETIELDAGTDGLITLKAIKTTTGDYAVGFGNTGSFVINIADNNIKIWADGAWRTLVSW